MAARGALWAWGNNDFGRLGDGTTTDRCLPGVILGRDAIQSEVIDAADHYALLEDGTVWAWGPGPRHYGAIARRTFPHRDKDTRAVEFWASPPGFRAIKADPMTQKFYALGLDGRVWTWVYGGDLAPMPELWDIDEIFMVQTIQGHQMFAQNRSGEVWNWRMELSSSITPVPSPTRLANVANVVSIFGHHSAVYALDAEGTVWSWGNNSGGRLGRGTDDRTDSPTPEEVLNLSDVIEISTGRLTTFALKSDGSVWAWGGNEYGQLGDGTTTDRNRPAPVTGLWNITQIACVQVMAYALKSDGTLWAWGFNGEGQLGIGSEGNNVHVPVQVSGLPRISAIHAGDFQIFVVGEDGTLWTWGDNEYGELGDGTTETRTQPVQVKDLRGVTAVFPNGIRPMAVARQEQPGLRPSVQGPSSSHRGAPLRPSTSGCYVATAVYGSYECRQLWVLRRWRDTSLASTVSGRAFTRFYYATSPFFVSTFGARTWFGRFFRPSLDGLVARLVRSGTSDAPYFGD